jgi:hypothetical protein
VQLQAVLGKARVAVEEQLDLTEFLRDHRSRIDDLIVNCEAPPGAADCGADPGASMAAAALPLAGRILLAGSSPADFRRAVEWVGAILPAADPVSALAALTLIYLVDRGRASAPGDSNRAQAWERIDREIETLIESAAS